MARRRLSGIYLFNVTGEDRIPTEGNISENKNYGVGEESVGVRAEHPEKK